MRIRAICIAVLAACGTAATHAAEIRAVSVRDSAIGTRAEIALSAPADYTLIRLAAPDRLVVDLPASNLSRTLALPGGSGAVARVRGGHPVAGTARLVFDLAQPVAALTPRVEQGVHGPLLVIEWPGDGRAPAVAGSPVAASIATPALTQLPAPRPTATPILPTPVIRDDAAQAIASADATSKLIAVLGGAGVRATATSPVSTSAVVPTVARAPARNPAVGTGLPGSTTSRPAPVAIASIPVPAPSLPIGAADAPARAAALDAATVTPLPGRIATGVPTRVATGLPASAIAAATTSAPQLSNAGGTNSRGTRSLVIAIDPGHGGQDPGAVGLNGNREKDVTLAISRELARQINATPGLKAFLTRDADMFLPLGNRARLARGAKADMFISIHADAAENRNARGSSVYVLSLKGASSQRARWLADKENRADLIGGARYKQADTMLTSVLLDLTQSGHMRASEDAGNEILSGLKRIGNHHKPHIERANFAVLRTSDMPSMLVETAFISNPEEEKRLVDPAFQKQLARAVLDGVDTYFRRQPPPGTLYALQGAQQSVAMASGEAP